VTTITNRTRVQNKLTETVLSGEPHANRVFYRNGEALVGPPVRPDSVICNEHGTKEYVPDTEYGLGNRQRPTGWPFRLTLDYQSEVSVESLETFFRDEITLPAENGLRQARIRMTDVDYDHHPPQSGPGGSRIVFGFEVIESRN